MRYNDYYQWVKYIENEYEKRSAEHRTRDSLSNEEVGGLQVWFKRVAERVDRINTELSRIKSIKYAGKSEKYIELDLITTAVAKAFYPECYDKSQDIVIKTIEKNKTAFYGSEKIGQFLCNNWVGTEVMPIKIPSTNPTNGQEESPYYWIEICSALQREYAVFRNIDDLNDFIFTVGQNKTTSTLLNYGFYIRDVQHLCLAFSILHGYSVAEYRKLYNQACATTVCGDYVDETVTAQIVRERFGNYLVCGSKTSDELLESIRKNQELLVHKYKSMGSHKSLINKCLDTIMGNGGDMSLAGLEQMKDRDSSIEGRMRTICESYIDQVDVSPESEAKKTDLRIYLRDRCMLDIVDNAYSSSDDGFLDSIDFLRCMLIISNLNGIKAAERRYSNAADLIDDINDQLIDCYMRPIDYSFDVDRATGSIINITHDMFDWVIIESLKFEQALYEKSIFNWSENDYSIWGETIMRYMCGDVETD